MGDQSSGKSSVLESLSGVPFPRGAGLVTKCATELRMHRIPSGEPWSAHLSLSWDKPQPADAGPVSSPEEIGPKIECLTEFLLAGSGRPGATFEAVHSIRIDLKSPDVPDLTVIDLPGIVRTAVEGQSSSVIQEVDGLLNRYLAEDRTVILAVLPVNVDIATADILERASIVDPDGKRTIGVLTKPDLVDKGGEDEVMAVLQGLRKPLRLGYVMVRNRSQEQVKNNLSLEEAKVQETAYFSGHSHYKTLDASFFGVGNLAGKLTTVLVSRIQATLPHIRDEVKSKLKEVSSKLAELGQGAPADVTQRRMEFGKYVNAVIGDVQASTDGNYSLPTFMQYGHELRVMARIREGPQLKFQTAIRDLMPKSEDEDDPWSVDALMRRIREMRGRELPGSMRPEVAEALVMEYVMAWGPPAHDLVDEVAKILEEVCFKVIQHHIPRDQYPTFQSEIKTVVAGVISARIQEVHGKCGVDGLLTDEQKPFTMNHYFMDTYNKIMIDKFSAVVDQHMTLAEELQAEYVSQGTIKGACAALKNWFKVRYTIGNKSNEQQEAEQLQMVLQAYWKTSSKRFTDNVCARIDSVLVRSLALDIRNSEGLTLLLAEDVLADLFKEDRFLQETRKMYQHREQVLQKALDVLQSSALITGRK